MKIGDLVLTDVSVSKTALFQVLRAGGNVGCIFKKDKTRLYLVHDYTDDTEVVDMPLNWQGFVKLVASFFAILMFSTVFSTLDLFPLLFCAVFLVLARSAGLAAIQSKKNWGSACGCLGISTTLP